MVHAFLPTMVGTLPAPSLPVYPVYTTRYTFLLPGCDTFNTGVEEGRPREARRSLFSLQNKPPPSTEIGLKRQRNPLQKALVHKDGENPSTPQEVTSNLPQGEGPLFHTFQHSRVTPGPGPMFLIFLIKLE